MKPLRKPLKILLYTNALILVSSAMLGPISAIFVEKVGGDLLDASFAGGVFALTAGVVTLISGRYSDMIKNESLVLVFGYFVMSIGFFMYLLVDSVMMLFVVQGIIGLGEAIYSPVFDSLYGKNLHKSQRSFEWGLWESTHYFTLAIGAFVGGVIVNTFGFNAIFIIMGSLSLASCIYIILLPKGKL